MPYLLLYLSAIFPLPSGSNAPAISVLQEVTDVQRKFCFKIVLKTTIFVFNSSASIGTKKLYKGHNKLVWIYLCCTHQWKSIEYMIYFIPYQVCWTFVRPCGELGNGRPAGRPDKTTPFLFKQTNVQTISINHKKRTTCKTSSNKYYCQIMSKKSQCCSNSKQSNIV